ncbi:haloacid dehalogenase-like hydrolase, putative [Synechococcus sp. PCC 7335]|uniref:HAD family hydrolase n=1 Tax=Synechococcus sp. (strain ATCC 29403 / PCC 7335) TaxID=91464 RepID=UPI00017EB176|nr:HAD family hydrolase [Synechococcus sp. PCC 7335]EDX86721.1 haloacid dehalogenase-like hydrolase, putative [Synechococcus sp. PCC 7335]
MTKQVVFCDFDGPIVDVSERYYQTYRQGLRAIASIHVQQTRTTLPISPLSKRHFWQMKQDRMADIEIAIRSGIPATWFEPFIEQVKQIVNHPSLLLCDRIQPSAQAALRHLRQSNIRLVLVTLRHPQQVNAFLQQQGVAHLVDEVYGLFDMNAAYVNRVEQKCELLAQAIAQQKVKGYRTHTSWMIGDTEADIIAARGMGLSAAALTCGVRSKAYLQKLEPTAIYDELLSAAKAAVQRANLQVASL